ncbi:hypothetical protein BN1723_004929 [Verticillium longisporum]|uniref:Uncharacterized protein n=1 Tax=Verticillium longisporum TaxID=100787 RepID=A0A0G4N308_VERLO|nr:hypothetical protein BN1708_004659 [Verticillium longisporum]CRK40817.1 hypothetical protein BN1723_004929 [Verticillium longisporum]
MPRRRRESQRLGSLHHGAVKANDSVNQLASLLLDSPELGHPDGLASHPSGYFGQINADDQRIDVASQRQPAAKSSPLREHKPPRPAIPRKSSLRRHKKLLRAESSPPDKSDLSRLVPKSKTSDLHPQNTFTRRRQTSDDLPGRVGRVPLSATAPLTRALAEVADTDDVSKKLQNMLAATEALKPYAKKQDSRVSRMSRKLATKASHAWDRIQGKKAASQATAVRKISAPLELGGGSYLRGGHYAVDSERSLARFEVTKTYLPSKASADGPEQSLSDHSDATNTFTDPSLLASPKTPTRQTGIIDPVTPVNVNPFDSDPDFSTDLNAVLSDRPLCASTPRTRRKEVPNAPIGTPSLGQQLVRDQVISKNTPILPRPDAVNVMCRDSVVSTIGEHMGANFMSSKKYPSPDKESLAELARQLQKMGIQDPSPGDEPKDELSHSFVTSLPSARTLAPRDRNLPMSQYLTKSEASACTPLSLRKSRIPGPVRSTRSEARFGLMAHPLDPGATELDELA